MDERRAWTCHRQLRTYETADITPYLELTFEYKLKLLISKYRTLKEGKKPSQRDEAFELQKKFDPPGSLLSIVQPFTILDYPSQDKYSQNHIYVLRTRDSIPW